MLFARLSLIALPCLFITTAVCSVSTPVHRVLGVVARQNDPDDLDKEPTTGSNGAEDPAKSIPSSPDSPNPLSENPAALGSGVPVSLNSLDTQLPQSGLDISSSNAVNNDKAASNDQGNPVLPTDSQNLALDTEDVPFIHLPLPNLGGSGEMNYGTNPIEGWIRALWHHPFDAKNQPEPDCKPRHIPWGSPNKLFEMFAFCCGGIPQAKGPNNKNMVRREFKRMKCKFWEPSEICNPDSIVCCFCRDTQAVGFECVNYYQKDAAATPKRDIISMRKRQGSSVGELASASSSVQPDDTKSSPLADDSTIAMAIEGAGRKPKSDSPGRRPEKQGARKDYVCRADFLAAQGIKYRQRTMDEFSDFVSDYKFPIYQPYRPEEENDDDYGDLKVPDWWPNP